MAAAGLFFTSASTGLSLASPRRGRARRGKNIRREISPLFRGCTPNPPSPENPSIKIFRAPTPPCPPDRRLCPVLPFRPPTYLSQGFYPRIFLSILPTTRSSPLVPCSPLTPSLPLCPAYRNSQCPSASHRPRKIPRALPQAPRSALSSQSASSPTRASAP